MDFAKLPNKEIKTFDQRKVADTAVALRKELVTMRMDVYNAGPQANAKARKMRKTLARLLTVAKATGAKVPPAAKAPVAAAKVKVAVAKAKTKPVVAAKAKTKSITKTK